jgi:YesN/AraC family two-component response regulator
MFIIAISVPALVIGIMSMRHSTDHIIQQVDLSSNNLLAEKKYFIEQQVAEVENITNLIIGSTEYWNLMQSNADPAQQHEGMYQMINFFNKRITADSNIASIYLINRDQNYVLSNAKYSLDEFYDQVGLQRYPIGGTFAGVPRRLENNRTLDSGLEKMDIISFFRSITDLNNGSQIDVLINLHYGKFAARLQSDNNPYQMDLLVFNDRNELILNQSGIKPDEKKLKELRGSDGSSGKLTSDKTDYYYGKTYSESLRWTFVYIQPYVEMVGTAALLGDVIRSTILVVVALALGLGIFFSISLYRPLGSLVSQVRKQTSSKSEKGSDEYSIIGAAVNALFQENHTLQSRYQLAYPYLKQHSVQELLSGNVWDPDKWDSIIELLGVQFTEPYYAVAVMDLENTEITDYLLQELENLLPQWTRAHLLSVINNRQLAVVINTSLENEGVHAQFCDIQEELNRRGIELTISISPICSGLNMLGLAYQEANRQLNNKFFVGKNQLIVNETSRHVKDSEAIAYKRLQEELLEGIRSQNPDRALDLLNQFMKNMAEQARSITNIKYLSFQVSTGLLESIMDVGGKLAESMEPEHIWERIDQSDTIQELKEFLEQFLQQCIAAAGQIKQKQHMELVGKAKEFIREHYSKDLSIKDIAASVYLSPGYLSTIFKSETGTTVLDDLTKVRMEAARELLHNGEIKVTDIAQAVGYNNAQSFIRFFKKTYQMTPMEYRRSLVLFRE